MFVQSLSGLEAAFPLRAGSHLRLTNPALEFVKSVCHVLSLDTTLSNEVQMLRQSMLRVVQVCCLSTYLTVAFRRCIAGWSTTTSFFQLYNTHA